MGVSRQWIVEVKKGKPRAELSLVLRTLAALEFELDVRVRDQTCEASSGAPWNTDLNAVIDRARRKDS